jgi:hypothetical protein
MTRIPRRKNPNAPWKWQYQGADSRWYAALEDAEYTYTVPVLVPAEDES